MSSGPLISMIAAMDENRLIGINNSLPWKLPADMKWFVKNTKGKTILVGRKTFESFGARPLKDRRNIIISRDPDYHAEGIEVATSIEDALKLVAGDEEVMIIGGATFYEQLLPQADRLYLTIINETFAGDAWFPEIDFSEWDESFREQHQADEDNPHNYTFYIYERKR